MTIKQMLRTLAAAAVVALVALPASADDPSGTVKIEGMAVALGVSYSWGDGVLTMNDGTEHKFKVKGISVIDVGMTSMNFEGEIYALDKLDKFPGTYSTAQAGVALVEGVGTVAMENENSVVMRLSSTQSGVRLTLAPGGLEVNWQ